jgi:hypothetical protein
MIGAEIIKKNLFVSYDLCFFRLPNELDHVALLSNTFFKNERIKKTRIRNYSNVFVLFGA